MRHAEARAEIETRFASVWTATPVAFENVAFEPPADDTAWVRLAVANDGAVLSSIGGPPRRWRCHGRVRVEINVPAGSGSRSALELADQALDLFASWPVSSLTFLAGSPEPAIQRGDLYRVTVSVPFRHDDLR
ncbi:phage tail terminator-like protein [Thalassobaculum sp.]|uniref:phage tail terminator-like protein n=1 Tax=Thalassobaculum sp. TaxID=2022740 RepID=UPI0032ED957F